MGRNISTGDFQINLREPKSQMKNLPIIFVPFMLEKSEEEVNLLTVQKFISTKKLRKVYQMLHFRQISGIAIRYEKSPLN